jgi:hypothetical protein
MGRIASLAVASALLGTAAPARAGFTTAGQPPPGGNVVLPGIGGGVATLGPQDWWGNYPSVYFYGVTGIQEFVTRSGGPAAHGLTSTVGTHATPPAVGSPGTPGLAGTGSGELFSSTGIRGYYYDSNGAHGFWAGWGSPPGHGTSPPAAGPPATGIDGVSSVATDIPALLLQPEVSAVPGPSGLVLAGIGVATLGVCGRRTGQKFRAAA